MTENVTSLSSEKAVAVLYDIHGKLPALDAALAAVETAGEAVAWSARQLDRSQHDDFGDYLCHPLTPCGRSRVD